MDAEVIRRSRPVPRNNWASREKRRFPFDFPIQSFFLRRKTMLDWNESVSRDPCCSFPNKPGRGVEYPQVLPIGEQDGNNMRE
jgi:hypothetical protein